MTDFHIDFLNSTVELESIYLSCEFSFSTLPERPNVYNYTGINVAYIFGIVKISGIVTSLAMWGELEYIHLNGTGDIQIESWKDQDEDFFMETEIQNGFDISMVALGFGDGSLIGIDRFLLGHIGQISAGKFRASLDLGDGDGYIYINSDNITFDNIMILYIKSGSNMGIRFSSPTSYFDADGYLLSWDTLYYDPPIVIPYNWQRQGTISSGKINIDIIKDGTYWYNFTLPPFASHGGPYEAQIFEGIYFDGTESFDPDDEIVQYDWYYQLSWH